VRDQGKWILEGGRYEITAARNAGDSDAESVWVEI